jgi:hypothetical protein
MKTIKIVFDDKTDISPGEISDIVDVFQMWLDLDDYTAAIFVEDTEEDPDATDQREAN